MSTLIVTMDPGAHKVGLCAGWLEEGRPFFVETLDVKTGLKGYARSVLVAKTAVSKICGALPDKQQTKALLVIEAMQSDNRTDSNKVADILDCQATGAAFACRMVLALEALNLSVNILSPTPSEWIKGMPKDVMRRQLTAAWPDVVTTKTGHDAVSAAGLFRWALPFARFS